MPPYVPEEHTTPVVLVAEDPFVGSFLRTLLQRRGYKVVNAQASHGMELMLAGDIRAALVITNTPEAFLPLADEIPLLYIAAAPDLSLAARFASCRVLRKPFHSDDLVRAVGELSGEL
ncbi:MAG TPA: hypothetical protein VLY04_19210 [Bryobacteraceae bacterium]|nr:hypothetical protein [Bryobacteraceae bacterium]